MIWRQMHDNLFCKHDTIIEWSSKLIIALLTNIMRAESPEMFALIALLRVNPGASRSTGLEEIGREHKNRRLLLLPGILPEHCY